MQQALDFREESDVLHELLAAMDDSALARTTLYKDWTVNDVVGHLHFWNHAADLALADEDAFAELIDESIPGIVELGHPVFTHRWLKGCEGSELVALWHGFYGEMSERFAAADPRKRVKWAGPDMSVRSSITARQMETWAHGQEVWDMAGAEFLGKACPNSDRAKNIVVLGVKTLGWAFMNRGLEVPDPAPYVRLASPSGETWEFNDPATPDHVEGDAVDFCRVVTQTRNVADTSLVVTGDTATHWMQIVQCFAGPPEDPPATGTRHAAA
ncbi:MAG TPA: TIGR03084 family protein [Deltaproteobacteria bacterium]|nr:TIGR03084 family protein [Candidatus Binatota bacterium]HIL13312.1 TIGR03084 family protein [Deltaproteobacteria bacterium]